MSRPDETTDKMFPPPESPLPPDSPIPLQPSIRSAFIAHHTAILQQFGDFRAEMMGLLDARLRGSVAPPPSPSSVRDTLKRGALAGLRYGGVALAVGEVGAEVAKALGRPEIEGPIRVLLQLLGGS
jgi:hypothetical protein